MANTHEYRPIVDEDKFLKALEYLTRTGTQLIESATGRLFSVYSLLVYSKKIREHNFIKHRIEKIGPTLPQSNSAFFYVNAAPSNLIVANQQIMAVGLMMNAGNASEGSANFTVDDSTYGTLKAEGFPDIHEQTSASGQTLLRVSSRHVDVIGFIISNSELYKQ